MRANFNKAAGRGPNLKLQCRYTNQITRKKKTWQDGIVKIVPSGNSFIMQLFDANDLRDQSLEGRLMTPKEADHFRRKALNEITLTNHMIELNFESEPAPYVPPVKVAKFKAPSVLARPAPNVERNIADHDVFAQYQSNSGGYGSRNASTVNPFSAPRDYRGPQRGDDFDDVDEIWGNDGKNGSRDSKRNEEARQIRPPVNSTIIQSRTREKVDSFSHHDDIRRVDSRSADFEGLREEPDNEDYDIDDYESQTVSTSSRREIEDEQPYQSNRKRPVSEVSRPSFDDHEEQQRQRPKQDNYPPRINPSTTVTNALHHDDSHLQIRGSMKRVDESIWDD